MEQALKTLLKHFEEEVEMNVEDKSDETSYWGAIEDYWDENIQRKGMLAQFYDYMAYKTFGYPMDKDNVFQEQKND